MANKVQVIVTLDCSQSSRFICPFSGHILMVLSRNAMKRDSNSQTATARLPLDLGPIPLLAMVLWFAYRRILRWQEGISQPILTSLKLFAHLRISDGDAYIEPSFHRLWLALFSLKISRYPCDSARSIATRSAISTRSNVSSASKVGCFFAGSKRNPCNQMCCISRSGVEIVGESIFTVQVS